MPHEVPRPDGPADDAELSPVDRIVLELVQLAPPARVARLTALGAQQPDLAMQARRRLQVLSDHDLLATEASDFGSPRVFGDYRLLRRLGSGGMGVVWLAEHPALQRTVALKVLHATALESERARARFRHEALAAARLDHPNLCPVHEVGEVEGVPFLAMRYVPGQTLSEWIEQTRAERREGSGQPQLRRVVELIERVARAIHCAHLAGLVHRDLKPDNLIIEPDGTPVVLDFGLAQDISTEDRLTVPGDRIGTPAYMAPEQIAGRGTRLDPRTDVYALGVVLYECLTLALPVKAADREGLYRAVAAGAAADAARRAPGLGRDLRVILAVAMAPEVEQRYASALALAEDLARYRAQLPILAQPAGTVLRVRRWTQRNPVAAVVISIFAAGLVLTGFLLRAVQASLVRAEDLARAGQARAIAQTDPVAGLQLALSAYGRTQDLETLCTLYASLADAHEVRVLNGHKAVVWRTVFSADGRFLASCSDDLTARIWDLRGELPTRELRHAHNVVDIDTDGSRLVTAGLDGQVKLWNFSGELLEESQLGQRRPPDDGCFRARFSRDGKLVAIASMGAAAWIWGIETRLAVPLIAGPGRVWDAGFSPDGELALTLVGYGDQIPPPDAEFSAWIWPRAEPRKCIELRGHTDSLTAADFSPDGKLILTASRDGTVRLWRATGEFLRTVVEHSSGIRCVQFHPRGELFAAGALDGSVRICKLDGSLVSHFAHDDRIRSLEFSLDGRSLLTAGWDRTARLHDLRGRLLRTFRGHANHIMHATFSPDGKSIATSSYDHTVRTWRAADSEFGIYHGHEDRVVAIACAPHGNDFATGSADGTVRIWTGERSQVLRTTAAANRVVFSPNGEWIATAQDDQTVGVWTRAGALRKQFPSPSNRDPGLRNEWRNSIVAFVDETRLLIGRQDGTVAICDLDGNPLPGPRYESAWERFDLAVHPRLEHFAEGRWDNRALIRTLDGRIVGEANHDQWVVKVQFSPKGEWLLTASADRTAKLWRWVQGRLERVEPPLEHEAAVTWAAFSPDGKRILTTSMDGVVRIWSIDGQELLRIHTGPSPVWCGAWSRNGDQILTGGNNGLVRSWPVNIEHVLELARARSRR